jgi:hypothetical protein
MMEMKIQPSLVAVQALPQKPVYRISEISALVGSRATAYRTTQTLQEMGFALPTNRGFLQFRSSLFQPIRLWSHLLPSLATLKQARYFGRSYDENDVSYIRNNVRGIETLDYRAYELTKFQIPGTLFVYVRDFEGITRQLKEKGFSMGTRGRIAILPASDSLEDTIQRVYLDCLAFGGRNLLDAIAIDLVYGNELRIRGEFPAELVRKVEEDMPR